MEWNNVNRIGQFNEIEKMEEEENQELDGT